MKYISFAILSVVLAWGVHGQNALLPAVVEGQQVVHHTAYSLGYSRQHGQPAWVAYMLTRQHAQGDLPRKDSFKADPLVEGGSATPADYTRSGYDKGHLAPNADMSWDLTVQKECYYMSNMSPQTHAFNAGLWSRLEALVRDWAIALDSLYVVTGPVLSAATIMDCHTVIRCDVDGVCDTMTDCVTLIETPNAMRTIGKNTTVTVPEYFYKVVYHPASHQAIALLVPHENKKGPLKAWAVTVDAVEAVTGLDFFPDLDDELEDAVEGNICVPCWNW